MPGVTAVVAVGHKPGPKDLKDALKSRRWTNILIGRNHKSTDVIVTVKDNVAARTINDLQAVQRRFDRPGFEVVISGCRTSPN